MNLRPTGRTPPARRRRYLFRRRPLAACSQRPSTHEFKEPRSGAVPTLRSITSSPACREPQPRTPPSARECRSGSSRAPAAQLHGWGKRRPDYGRCSGQAEAEAATGPRGPRRATPRPNRRPSAPAPRRTRTDVRRSLAPGVHGIKRRVAATHRFLAVEERDTEAPSRLAVDEHEHFRAVETLRRFARLDLGTNHADRVVDLGGIALECRYACVHVASFVNRSAAAYAAARPSTCGIGP